MTATDDHSPQSMNEPTGRSDPDGDLWTMAVMPRAALPQARYSRPRYKQSRGKLIATVVVGLLLLAWSVVATIVSVRKHNDGVSLRLQLNGTLADLDQTNDDLASTKAELETTVGERDELALKFLGAEYNRSQLDEQLEETAGAKADAEDERESLRQLVIVAGSVTDSMERCANDNAAVTVAFVNYVGAYPYGSPVMLDAALTRMKGSCSTAQADARELEAIVASVT